MIRSMTGFGHDELSGNGITITAEIRAVNHRYCDISVRLPKMLHKEEEKIRSVVAEQVSRGKIDVVITIDSRSAEMREVVPDISLAASYISALKDLAKGLGLDDDIKASNLLQFPDVMKVERKEISDDLVSLIVATTRNAVSALTYMREREGERLEEAMRCNLSAISTMISEVAIRAPLVVQEFKDKLDSRILDLVDVQKLDPARLATEVALFAEKSSIDEELVRLGSHLLQFGEMLGQGSPIGKKLDFLIQEMNREVNTIGSKSNHLDITRIVVDLKSEVEKLREQIQNIE